MPFQYSKEERLAAFRLLVQTMGDVHHVSNETGISPRTLQYWKQQYRIKVTQSDSTYQNPEAKYYRDQYRAIREKLFRHLMQGMEALDDMQDPTLLADLTPSLARLIDRIAKLEDLIAPGEVIFHLQWVNEEDELPVTDSDVYIHERMQQFKKIW